MKKSRFTDEQIVPILREVEDGAKVAETCFCIHCAFAPGEGKYDFRLKDWIWDMRDNKPYGIPFRCLYSANIDNLLIAGKRISVTHVAASSVKFMGNGAQHGIAVAAAALLCKQFDTTPRGLYDHHLDALKALVNDLTACEHVYVPHAA